MIEFNAKGWDEKALAIRWAAMIHGEGDLHLKWREEFVHRDQEQADRCCPFKKDNGNWQLDNGNNWFMEFDPETGYCKITYRYNIMGSSEDAQAAMEGLKAFFEWRYNK